MKNLSVNSFSHLQYFDRRRVFDPFLVQPGTANDPFQGQPNPWISDTVDFWQHDKMLVKHSSIISGILRF